MQESVIVTTTVTHTQDVVVSVEWDFNGDGVPDAGDSGLPIAAGQTLTLPNAFENGTYHLWVKTLPDTVLIDQDVIVNC